jgi:hypothetical protein
MLPFLLERELTKNWKFKIHGQKQASRRQKRLRRIASPGSSELAAGVLENRGATLKILIFQENLCKKN